MPAVKRRLFNLLTAASLLMCAASLSLFALPKDLLCFVHIEHWPRRYAETQAGRRQLRLWLSIFTGSNKPVGTWPWSFRAQCERSSPLPHDWPFYVVDLFGIRVGASSASVAPQLVQHMVGIAIPRMAAGSGIQPVPVAEAAPETEGSTCSRGPHLRPLRLRPPRHAHPLPGMRHGPQAGGVSPAARRVCRLRRPGREMACLLDAALRLA